MHAIREACSPEFANISHAVVKTLAANNQRTRGKCVSGRALARAPLGGGFIQSRPFGCGWVRIPP